MSDTSEAKGKEEGRKEGRLLEVNNFAGPRSEKVRKSRKKERN